MIGTRLPSSAMMMRARWTSRGERTNDSATRSTPRWSAQRRSSSSFALSAAAVRATPGRFRPLLSETFPPTTTSVRTRTPSVSITRSRTLPSSTRIGSPGETSLTSGGKVVPTSSFVPTTSSEVIVKVSPTSSRWGPSANRPSRIFGSLQVCEDPHRVPGRVARAPHVRVREFVHGALTVAEVESRDVQPRADELLDRLVGRRRRTQRGDDLGTTHGPLPPTGSDTGAWLQFRADRA